ncbi:trichohyalin-like [Dorcoceras hygrometricum]|uniref:Trichohyalin-like n=1 Tax=Dorcoceras hygrometricum TaxID=472368 RepID=A0A2Z7A7W2_9LAMI|nr:trichohyalin-like [Dorcoceras hygrometricum]
MADHMDDDEVFDFSNVEFTREDLFQALNDMVHEYKTLSHTFEKIKAENASLKNSSAESSSDELEDTDSLKTELSKLRIENELLRSESSELKAEVEKLTKEMSSWTQSARAFHKLQEIQKSAHDRTGLGFGNSESSEGETSTQSQPVYDKFNKMGFVKADVIYDYCESIRYDDQKSSQSSHEEKGKDGIGYQRPESSKPSWRKQQCLRQPLAFASKETAMLTLVSSHMFRGISDAYISAIVGRLFDKKQQCLRQPLVICSLGSALLTKSYFRHSLHSTMASAFITYSYQINFESVLMMHDHDGMLNMFKALETSGLRGFLGCESVLYEKELQQFFETALVQGEYITGTVSGKFFSISQAQFSRVFELPTEGVVNFSEVPRDRVYDARSFFSKKGEKVEIHGKKKPMKYEFRLLNDTKGFAAQISVLLKGIYAVTLGEGVPFPSAKILSMKTVNTYIATNTTIDAHEEQGMIGEVTVKRKSKSTKQSSSADNTPVKVISEVSESRKRVATEDIAPVIPTKRRTVKTKHSSSQASLNIMPVAQDVVPIQVIDPTPAAEAIKSPALKQKSRKRRLVLTTGSDDETMGQQEIVKDADAVAVTSTDEADIIIAKVLEETLELGVSETERGGQGVDEAVFEEDFARWLDDFVARNNFMKIKKVQREQDAKIAALDAQIAAIRNEQLDFQAKIAADILSLSTQIGDIADYIRIGDAKKGEIGSSSRRPPPVRVERRPLPTPTNQGESSSSHGRVLSVEEAAEMVREADRQADRREREREIEKRLRRLRRRGH